MEPRPQPFRLGLAAPGLSGCSGGSEQAPRASAGSSGVSGVSGVSDAARPWPRRRQFQRLPRWARSPPQFPLPRRRPPPRRGQQGRLLRRPRRSPTLRGPDRARPRAPAWSPRRQQRRQRRTRPSSPVRVLAVLRRTTRRAVPTVPRTRPSGLLLAGWIRLRLGCLCREVHRSCTGVLGRSAGTVTQGCASHRDSRSVYCKVMWPDDDPMAPSDDGLVAVPDGRGGYTTANRSAVMWPSHSHSVAAGGGRPLRFAQSHDQLRHLHPPRPRRLA